MLDYTLQVEKLAELRAAHRKTHDKCEADRIKAVVLRATGWKVEQNKGKDDPLYFMDAVHPEHNPVIVCSWMKRGEDREI